MSWQGCPDDYATSIPARDYGGLESVTAIAWLAPAEERKAARAKQSVTRAPQFEIAPTGKPPAVNRGGFGSANCQRLGRRSHRPVINRLCRRLARGCQQQAGDPLQCRLLDDNLGHNGIGKP